MLRIRTASPCFVILGVLAGTITAGNSAQQIGGLPPQAGPVALNKQGTVLLDQKHRKLILKTEVCLREGVLEMLLCPRQTKEHESIVSLDAQIAVVHAGLLALGAKPGHVARFRPSYTPPEGQKINIIAVWTDEDGAVQKRPAQQWVRRATHRYFEAPLASVPEGVVLDEGDDSLRYDSMNKLLLWYGTMTQKKRRELLAMSAEPAYHKAIEKMFQESQYEELNAEFVFSGSGFATLEDGTQYYRAESGSAICVANFSDAMIDINIQSTASNDAGLMYEPYTERIPPVGTKVDIELIPVFTDQQAAAPDPLPQGATPPDEDQ